MAAFDGQKHSVRENGSVSDILSTRLPVLLLPLGLTYRGVSNGEKRNSRFHGCERARKKNLSVRETIWKWNRRCCLDAAYERNVCKRL